MTDRYQPRRLSTMGIDQVLRAVFQFNPSYLV